MTKAEISALEKVWIAEIANRLPFQSRAEIYEHMEADGLVQRDQTTWKDQFGTMRIEGWALTHAGRLSYCMTCTDEPSGDSHG